MQRCDDYRCFFFFSERFCSDPPDPPYRGVSDWDGGQYSDGRTPHKTEVTYSCGLGMRFTRRGSKELYSEKKFRCQWDGSWSPADEVSM